MQYDDFCLVHKFPLEISIKCDTIKMSSYILFYMIKFFIMGETNEFRKNNKYCCFCCGSR